MMKIRHRKILRQLDGSPIMTPEGPAVLGPLVVSMLYNTARPGMTPEQLKQQMDLAAEFLKGSAADVNVTPEEAALVRELALRFFSPLVAHRVREAFSGEDCSDAPAADDSPCEAI